MVRAHTATFTHGVCTPPSLLCIHTTLTPVYAHHPHSCAHHPHSCVCTPPSLLCTPPSLLCMHTTLTPVHTTLTPVHAVTIHNLQLKLPTSSASNVHLSVSWLQCHHCQCARGNGRSCQPFKPLNCRALAMPQTPCSVEKEPCLGRCNNASVPLATMHVQECDVRTVNYCI